MTPAFFTARVVTGIVLIVLSIYVSFMLDEKFTNIEVAPHRRHMQRSVGPKQRKGEKDGSKPEDMPAYSSAHGGRVTYEILAFTSAFCSTRKWQMSRLPCIEDRCRAVNPLKKEVHKTLEGKVMTPDFWIARMR